MPVKNRSPRQLLLALFGENLDDEASRSVRTGALIAALEPLGVTPSAVRVALNRLVHTGVLKRRRHGRETDFSLTETGIDVLTEASERVRRPELILVDKIGWTLCTFSVPEQQRATRHRLRSILTWADFAPVRDGLWLAPGEVDLTVPLRPLKGTLPEGSLLAFHASVLPGFPIGPAVRQAWDIEAIRAAHTDFIATWSDAAVADDIGTGLAAMTALVADWLSLLRADPGLPREYMGSSYASERSVQLYTQLRQAWGPTAREEFAELRAGRQTGPRQVSSLSL